jgi:hypothetical protein
MTNQFGWLQATATMNATAEMQWRSPLSKLPFSEYQSPRLSRSVRASSVLIRTVCLTAAVTAKSSTVTN